MLMKRLHLKPWQFKKELNIPDDKFNPDGGAIALGHPLAASGARITAHLLYALKERNKKSWLGKCLYRWRPRYFSHCRSTLDNTIKTILI